MLAIGKRSREFRSARTSPVAPFSTMKDRPCTGGGPASAGVARMSAAAAARRSAFGGLTGGRIVLPDAESLADAARVRIHLRIEGDEVVDGGVEMLRHRAERVAATD